MNLVAISSNPNMNVTGCKFDRIKTLNIVGVARKVNKKEYSEKNLKD